MKQTVYNSQGKEAGSIDLPENIFGLDWNPDLVHQVVTGMQSNARLSSAHSKDRSEVSGTGRKPWRQKGTGNARHGSRRSPIWRTGGAAFGPSNEKDYTKKINKKMKAKALYTALSQKMRDGQIIFVSPLEMKDIKSKDAQGVVTALSNIAGFETLDTKKANNIFLTIPEKDEVVEKSFRNLANVTVEDVRNLNALDVLNYRYMVITAPEASVEFLAGKTNKAPKQSAEEVTA
jgi:large subunit ribosomal protein L4